MANNRFKRGSGAFRCECCKRLTRSTGNSNEFNDLCYECYYQVFFDPTEREYENLLKTSPPVNSWRDSQTGGY